MLLIRPLLRANAWRGVRVHVVVFFLFLVANIGGSLTPLGDPPLFLGFLKGVDFFWPTRAMFLPMLVLALALLVIFYGVDRVMMGRSIARSCAVELAGVESNATRMRRNTTCPPGKAPCG